VGDAVPFLDRSVKLAEEVFQLWQSQQRGQDTTGAIQREVRENGKPLRRNYQDGGVRLVHASEDRGAQGEQVFRL
jgi:hypothetical protein